jgi:glycosyltransferase involved in cell wall biosynthesis
LPRADSQVAALSVPETHAADAAPESLAVLYLIHGIGRAGPELRLLELARRFPAHIRMHVAVVGHDLTLRPEFEQAAAAVLHLPVDRPYADRSAQTLLAAYVRTHSVRVINSFDLKTLMLALLVGMRVPSVRLTHHMVSLWDDVLGLRRHFYSALLYRTHALVCNGRAVRDGLVRSARLRAKTTVIPNGVDTARFRPDAEARRTRRAQLNIPQDGIVFGTVSTMRPVKNIAGLLRAFAEVLRDRPCYLLCVGGGPGYAESVRDAAALGIGQQTRFVGDVPDPETFLAAMDVFVLPSLCEGNPNALLEALAVGLPSIGSAVGEIPYLLSSESVGLLVPPGDTAALAKAMRQIRDVDRGRMRDHILVMARRELDATRMVDAYANHLLAVAAPRAHTSSESR